MFLWFSTDFFLSFLVFCDLFTVKPNTLCSNLEANISTTDAHINMGSPALGSESKNWQLDFFALDNLFVTLSFDFGGAHQMSNSLDLNE